MCHGNLNAASKPADTSDNPSCPFNIRQLNSTTYLVREHDSYGEYPHIYVRLCSQTNADGDQIRVILVNDTGVGTTVVQPHSGAGLSAWTIKSFLDHNFNQNGDIPYLVILSHCHFDHILGLNSLLPSEHDGSTGSQQERNILDKVTVLSSSHQPSFLKPHSVLEEHSLCNFLELSAPVYETSIWAKDHESVVYNHPAGIDMQLPVVTLHTPGHTPDSLSWYDIEERILYVGDSLYEQISDDSNTAPWGPERPAPIIFTKESDLFQWWRSIGALIDFVAEKNCQEEQRVTLAAGHVTALVDAQSCLLAAKEFIARVLRDEVHFVSWPLRRGEPFGKWTDDPEGRDVVPSKFSVGAPIRIVEEGRKTIPEKEWCHV